MLKNKSKKKTPKRKIMKAKIDFISLCPMGANTFSTVYKSDDGKKSNVELTTLCKDMTEQGEIICCVYAPNIVDSQGDIASAAVIKDFAYNYAQDGIGIDIRHNEDVLDKEDVFVAETMIIQKNDPRFVDMRDYDGNIVDVTGGWGVVIKVDDEELRDLYRTGEWSGVSMGGMMLTQNVSDDSKVVKMLKEVFSGLSIFKKMENNTMLSKEDKTEITELVLTTIQKQAESEAEKVKKEAEEKIKKEAEEKPEKKLGLGYSVPVLKANPSTEDIEKHRKLLVMHKLSEDVDSTDHIAIFEFGQKCKEIAKCDNLNEVLKKQQGQSLESYFTTNQGISEITKANGNEDDPISTQILADLKKEDEAQKVA